MTVQHRTNVTSPGYPLVYQGPLIPMTLPKLALAFPKNAISSDASDLLKSQGAFETFVQGVKLFIVNDYDAAFLGAMNRAGNIRTCPSPDETINMAVIPALSLVRKILSCFLRTHTYPAFTSPSHVDELDQMHLIEEEEPKTGEKRKRTSGRDSRRSKRPLLDESGAEDTTMDAVDNDEESEEELPLPVAPKKNDIKVALPPVNNVAGWGDESEIPVTYGNFCRFIPELADSDNRTISRVISRYFIRSLGESETTIHSTLLLIRTMNGIVASTLLGREWSHLFACIDLGLQAQCRIFPVYSGGVYAGCVLSGFGHRISLYDQVFTAAPVERLRQLVVEASPHQSTLDAIENIVGDQQGNFQLSWDEVTSMLTLRNYVNERSLSQQSRDEVVKLARKLRFSQTYWPLSMDHLVAALSHISEPSDYLPDSIVLHPSKLFEKDYQSCIWSTFGPIAPSCVFPGGPMCSLEDSTSSSGKIAWKTAPLDESIREMKTVFSDRSFPKSAGNRRSGGFKDRFFEGNQAKRLWDALKLSSGVNLKGKEKAAKESGPSIDADDLDIF